MPKVQATFDEVSQDYAAFVDKFKPKKTTDDCYTPANVFDAVKTWAANKYGFDPEKIVRPFWPGADYTRANYPAGHVVLDNPPFSILSNIVRFYMDERIRFFLFAPCLTLFSIASGRCNYIVAGCSVTYANGAQVNTSFVTNMGDYLIETAPDLRDAVKAADDENRRQITKELPVYSYPPDVAHPAGLNYLAVHHTPFRVKREEAVFIRSIDAQRETGKSIFGGGFLLSARAAAERSAAERAAAERAAQEITQAHVWELSDRERKLQDMIIGNPPFKALKP